MNIDFPKSHVKKRKNFHKNAKNGSDKTQKASFFSKNHTEDKKMWKNHFWPYVLILIILTVTTFYTLFQLLSQ